MEQTSETGNSLLVLQRFEDLLNAKLELCMQLQSLVDTSAQSLDAFRTHCSTSRELIKDEIRMLEGKLIQRIGRQLAMRKILRQHFARLSQELHLTQYLETDLDMFLAQQEASKDSSQVSSQESLTPPTADNAESAITCVLDKIKLILDEELSQLPSLKQWLEIVGLQPACVKGVMELVGSVEDLLQTSESKLKAVIVAASGVCTCRPLDNVPDETPSVAESGIEDSGSIRRESINLRIDTTGNVKEKGKLPFHIREDVRRMITACRLLRLYTDRLLTEDTDLKELSQLDPTQLAALISPSGLPAPVNSSTSSSATPPNSLVRKESVKNLYWDSWRYRPSVTPSVATPQASYGDFVDSLPSHTVNFCSIHPSAERRYGIVMDMRREERLPSMLSSFSSDDNFLSSPSTSQSQFQVPYSAAVPSGDGTANRGNSHRLTSQSSVMSSVSTATTTGDEADLGSTFADLASASSSCANSVFPSANNILQLVQQYETSPATMKRQYGAVGVDETDSRSQQNVFPSSGADSNVIIRPSSSTPSLLMTGLNPIAGPRSLAPGTAGGVIYHPGGVNGSLNRKELVKFTKSSSLESSLRSRLNSDDIQLGSSHGSGSSDSSSTANLVSAAKMAKSQLEKMHNTRRMHHSIHHVFKNNFFLSHAECAFCGKILRGLGRKCRHCKLKYHPDCADKVPPSCGLPLELVKEYYRTVHLDDREFQRKERGSQQAAAKDEFKVEEDDDTLSELTKRKPSEVEVPPLSLKYATISKGSDLSKEAGKPRKPNFRLFGPKTPPVLDSPASEKPVRVKKQRSMSTGNAREDLPRSPILSPKTPMSPELKSPISRRISGSFSLPRDKRKKQRANLALPKPEPQTSRSFQNLSAHQREERNAPREARLFSDPSPMEQERADGEKRRTVSASSNADGASPSPGHNSQDSLSAPSSSHGSSAASSMPASPGGISYGRSPSTSLVPPVSPLALTAFVNPKTYRSFMRTVKDQIKSHFHWPAHHHSIRDSAPHGRDGNFSDSHSEPRKTPVFGRRKSVESQSSHRTGRGVMTPEEEEESMRQEAEDSFPEEPSNSFSTVLVQPNALLEAVKREAKASATKKEETKKAEGKVRRFSLLEPQEEAEVPVTAAAVLQVPNVEVEDDNEPSFSSEFSGDHSVDINGSPIPWRRQQSLYLRELNIPFEQLQFSPADKMAPGTFGQAYRGKWHGDVAIKILNDDYLYNDADDVHEAFKQDLAALRKTRHDNLVLFMGACMKRSHDRHQQIIVTSLLSRGISAGATSGNTITLHDLIHEQKGKSLASPYKVQLNRLLIIGTQVAQGMAYLHRRGIVHKDLKTKNVFVTHEKCIITDYGLFSISKMSQHGRDDDVLWFPRNWLCYLAPEVCRRLRTPRQQKRAFLLHHQQTSDPRYEVSPFTIFSDVYAFGTILYELSTGYFPALYSASNALRLAHSVSASSMHSSGLMTPSADTPATPSLGVPPSTPGSMASFASSGGSSRGTSRPLDPNLPQSLESALFLLSTSSHPIFRMFRSRTNQSSRSGSSSTPPGSSQTIRNLKHPGSPPQSLVFAPNTPPTPVHAPVNYLSSSIEEAAAKDLMEIISLCWSPKISQRKEFSEVYTLLEKIPKKTLVRSPSHPVHGNAPSYPKDMIHY